MLVCSVSAPHRVRAEIAEVGAAIDTVLRDSSLVSADIVETSAAIDDVSNGVTFPALVDDPASANETLDAYLGEIMLEAASADDIISWGLAYDAAISETATAADTVIGAIQPAFTTFNPADLANITLSNGNLSAAAPSGLGGVRGTGSHTSGKNYWEYKITAISSNGLAVGIALASASLTAGAATGCAIVSRTGTIAVNTSTGISLGIRAVNDVIGVAVDFTAALIWFRVAPSGLWNNSGTADPATGTGGISISALSGALYPVFVNGQAADAVTANFGASGFTGSVPSGFTSGF